MSSPYWIGQTGGGLPVSVTVDGVGSHLTPPGNSEVGPHVMGVILSVAACLIVSTNLLVGAALLRLILRRGSQSWCFVLNLVLADALVGVSITGLAAEDLHFHLAGADLHANGTAPAAPGRARCLLKMASMMSPCTASIMSIFLIALDRYAAIKMPLRYLLLSGRGTAAGALLALWTSSLMLGFSPVMVQQLQSKKHYHGYCTFFSVMDEVAIIALFSVCFFPVLSVFVYIYLDILKIAYSHQRQICRVRQASCRPAGPPEAPGGPPQCLHHPQQQLRSFYWSDVKALRTVALLVGCFLLLWCPFFVVGIVDVLCTSCALQDELESVLWLLGLCNSLINPLVYSCWQREVRLQLAAMLACGRSGGSPAGPPPRPPGVPDRCEPRACVPTGETLHLELVQTVSGLEAPAAPTSTTTNF